MGLIKRELIMGGLSISKDDTVTITKQRNQKDSVIKNPKDKSSIIVYPNPVAAGASIHINCQNFAEGYYQFQILDISGQLIRQTEIWIDKEASLFDMVVPASASAGTYLVTLISRQTEKKFAEKIIVQH